MGRKGRCPAPCPASPRAAAADLGPPHSPDITPCSLLPLRPLRASLPCSGVQTGPCTALPRSQQSLRCPLLPSTSRSGHCPRCWSPSWGPYALLAATHCEWNPHAPPRSRSLAMDVGCLGTCCPQPGVLQVMVGSPPRGALPAHTRAVVWPHLQKLAFLGGGVPQTRQQLGQRAGGYTHRGGQRPWLRVWHEWAPCEQAGRGPSASRLCPSESWPLWSG